MVAFALLAALAFGMLPLSLRVGLRRTEDSTAGAFVQNLIGLVVCGAFALARSQSGGDLTPFVRTGLLGLAELLLCAQALRVGGEVPEEMRPTDLTSLGIEIVVGPPAIG